MKLRDHYPYGKNRTNDIIELMKDDFDVRIMKELVVLRPKMYGYLTDDGHDKKAKRSVQYNNKLNWMTTKYVWKNITILRTQQRYRSETRNEFAGKASRIVLSVNDDERIQTPNGVQDIIMIIGVK